MTDHLRDQATVEQVNLDRACSPSRQEVNG
jgi:hypothetical protein